MRRKIIDMEHIRKTYDGKRYVLDDLSFCAQKGEFIIIKGQSGSGKSTLMNILGLLDTFDSGKYTLNDTVILPEKQGKHSVFRSKMIGFIFQAYHLIDSITIQENILLPFLYSDERISQSVVNSMENVLKRLNLYHLKGTRVTLLSGGEKQRVAIARAVVKNPEIIIADEPTGNLDDENSRIVMSFLKELSSNGTTVILVTHNMNLLDYSDRFYTLHEGRLINEI